MQKVIHKYTARIPEESHLPLELTLPEDHQIIHVADTAERGEALTFWALVDPESDHITRELLTIPTGDPVDEEHVHLATVRTRGGRIVIHVMEHVDDLPPTEDFAAALAAEDEKPSEAEEKAEEKAEETQPEPPKRGRGRNKS